MRPADPTQVLRSVGRRIAELRRAVGLTQEQFAEEFEASVSYIRRVEAGSENLTLVTVVKIANILRVLPADLLQLPQSSEVRRGRPPRTTKREP